MHVIRRACNRLAVSGELYVACVYYPLRLRRDGHLYVTLAVSCELYFLHLWFLLYPLGKEDSNPTWRAVEGVGRRTPPEKSN